MWALSILSLIKSELAVRDGLRYNKSHEWAKAEGDVATVGISDFAQVPRNPTLLSSRGSQRVDLAELLLIHLQAELGDVVYVELPEVGTEVEQGETFGVIESVKVPSQVSQSELAPVLA